MRISSICRMFLNLKLSAIFLAVMLFSLFGLSTFAGADDWPMFLKDSSHSSTVERSPSLPLTLKWKFETKGPIYSSPVVVGNTVFIASYDNFLYALDAATAKVKWKFETGGEILSTPAVSEGVIYFGSKDGHLYALAANSGKLKWKFDSGAPIFTSPVTGMGGVYFGTADTYLYAVSIKSGKRIWRAKLKEYTKYGGIYSSPAYNDGAVYIASKNKRFYSYDAETGARNWNISTRSAIYSSPIIDEDMIYITSFDRKIYGYKVSDSTPVFRRSIKEWAYSTPIIYGDSLYLGLKNSDILVLNKKNGKKENVFSLPGAINSTLAIDPDGIIYAGSADGNLYLLKASSGEIIWKYKTGAGIHSSPAIAGGVVYIGSKDGTLYAFE